MTLEEAIKVADICSQADGGCDFCVVDLKNRLQKAFSSFIWAFKEGKILVEEKK